MVPFNIKWCTPSSHHIQVEKSQLESYTGRSVFGQAFKDLNLVEIFKSYQVFYLKVVSRKELTVICTISYIARVPACQVLDSIASIASWENTPAKSYLLKNGWNICNEIKEQ